MAETKSAMVIANVDLPLFLTLDPNPESINFASKKAYSKTQTLGGWVYEHRGAQPDVMKVSGWTPARIDVKDRWLGMEVDRTEKVETYLIQLQQLVKLDKERMVNFAKNWRKIINAKAPRLNSIINPIEKAVSSTLKVDIAGDGVDPVKLARTYIYYRGTIYQGFFDSFDYMESVTHPARYKYNFNFIVVGSSTDYVMGIILNLGRYGPLREFLINSTPLVVGRVRAIAP